MLEEGAQRHPANKRVVRLLNYIFYQHKNLSKRLAVLHAAAWLLGVLEELSAY